MIDLKNDDDECDGKHFFKYDNAHDDSYLERKELKVVRNEKKQN